MLKKLRTSSGFLVILLVMISTILTASHMAGAVYGQGGGTTYFPLVFNGCVNAIPFQPASNLAIEIETLAALNHQRAVNGGLSPLVMNDSLVQIARFHSMDMAVNGIDTHEGSAGESVEDRYDWLCETFTAGGEIIGMSSSGSVENIVRAWMSSDGHRDLILSPNFTLAGVGYVYLPGGVYSHFWTVDFGSQ